MNIHSFMGRSKKNPLNNFINTTKWITPLSDWQSKNFTPHPKDKAYEVTAAQKFGQRNLNRLPLIGYGRDRGVFALDDNKVIKIAKNPGGLSQNVWEKDLEYLGQLKHFETGKDYVVMERVQPPGKATTKFLRPIKKAIKEAPMIRMGASNIYEKDIHHPKVQEALENAGINDFRDFSDLSVGDLTRKANWGEKDGRPVLVDAGTLNAPSLRTHRVKDFENKARMLPDNPPWELKDWREIQRERSIYRGKGKEYPYDSQRYADIPNTPYPEAQLEDFPIIDTSSKSMVWAKGLDAEWAGGEGISFATGHTNKQTGEYTNKGYLKKRVLMSPDEVLRRQFEQRTTDPYAIHSEERFEKWKRFGEEDRTTIEQLKKAIKDPKEQVPLVIEEFDEEGHRKPFQEGRKRAISAKELGEKTMPVMLALKLPDAEYPEYSKHKTSDNTAWDVTLDQYPEDLNN